MNILKLQILVLIDKYHKVTEVAQSLKLKQPTVSFHMKKMEQELGVRLFEIGRGRTSLTGAGKVLLNYAKQITTLDASARQALKDYTTQHAAQIRIAAEEIPGNFILPTLIANYSSRYPTASVKLVIQTRDKVLSMLATGEVDIGFTHQQPDASLGLSSSLILEDGIGIIHSVADFDHIGHETFEPHNSENRAIKEQVAKHRITDDRGTNDHGTDNRGTNHLVAGHRTADYQDREHLATGNGSIKWGTTGSSITERWVEEQMKANRFIVQDATSLLGQFVQRWCEHRELNHNAALEMNSIQALAGMVLNTNLLSFYPRIASYQLPQSLNWQAVSVGQGTDSSPLYRYQVWMHSRGDSLGPAGEQLTALINEWSRRILEKETAVHSG
ncbi:HTH-type transcriptional activator CmpR [compost metagenome]